MLTRLVLREDAAEDLMRELFLKLRRSDGFLEARNPTAYAYRTAITLACNWRRGQQRARDRVARRGRVTEEEVTPLSHAIRAEEIQRILDAISHLPDLSREAVVMR